MKKEEGDGKNLRKVCTTKDFFCKVYVDFLNSYSFLCKLWIKGRKFRGITGASSRSSDKQNV